jgi:hypothetical protein
MYAGTHSIREIVKSPYRFECSFQSISCACCQRVGLPHLRICESESVSAGLAHKGINVKRLTKRPEPIRLTHLT